jgi:uncharacterized protein
MNRVVIVPGNGCTSIKESNWYGWLYESLCSHGEFDEVVCENMPDPYGARRDVWIPFLKDVLQIDENTIAIGHSSGSEALMRFAETEKVGAIILVSACYSDLGDADERASGYYPSSDGTNPWNFPEMRRNCSTWRQFHSDTDPFISLDEAERVRNGLQLVDGTEYFMLRKRSHFFDYPFPELYDLVISLKQLPS